MARPTLTFDSPVEPADFHGRGKAVRDVCDRLSSAHLLSTSVVGGPKTGKTSLLRYLASPQADGFLPGRARVYLDVLLLSSTASPTDFWVSALRAMDAALPPAAPRDVIRKTLEAGKKRKLDTYDAEDVFDACAKANVPVVLLLDNFENLLENRSFWGDFFHIIRALGQRTPRGLGFVTATQRSLLDLFNVQFGSPYYNIFLNVSLGRLTPKEIEAHVERVVGSAHKTANVAELSALVQAASDRHPYLVSYLTALALERLDGGLAVETATVRAKLVDPAGALVQLVRMINKVLTLSEQQAVEAVRASPKQLTALQRSALQRLDDHGLLPPGTKLP